MQMTNSSCPNDPILPPPWHLLVTYWSTLVKYDPNFVHSDPPLVNLVCLRQKIAKIAKDEKIGETLKLNMIKHRLP
jgi:hypothetical protein